MLKFAMILLISLLLFNFGLSQPLAQDIDSLKFELAQSSDDTTSIRLNLHIGHALKRSQVDSAIYHYNTALEIINSAFTKKDLNKSEKNTYRLYKAKLLKNIGDIQRELDNYPSAKDSFEQALAIFIEIDNQSGISECYNGIGTVNVLQGNYIVGMEYHHKSLVINEKLGDKNEIINIYNNIGNIHFNQENYLKAFEQYEKANKLAIELNNQNMIAVTTMGKGNVYFFQDDYSKALECFKSSLAIHKTLDNKHSIGNCINNIGFVYNKMGDYSKALEYFNEAVVFQKESGNKRNLVRAMLNIVDCYIELGDPQNGLEYSFECLEISKEINAPILLASTYGTLSLIHEKSNDFREALKYHKLYLSTNESLFNINRTNTISELEAKYEAEKKEREIALLKSQTLSAELLLNKETNYRNLALLGILATLIVSLLIYISFLRKQRINILLGMKVSRRTKKLFESEMKYRKLIEHSNDVIFMLRDDKLEIYNDKLLDMLAITKDDVESEGFDLRDFISIEDRETVKEQEEKMRNGETLSIHTEFSIVSNVGDKTEIEAIISLIDHNSVHGIIRDISDRKKLELQLLQSQKMEALGKLAGGIAHDFNNLLTSIIGHAEMAIAHFGLSAEIQGNLKEIIRGSESAAKLTHQILAFSRKQVMELKISNINYIITDIEKMLNRTIGEDIELTTHLTDNVWKVKVDHGQIMQVIMNMVVNARDAMPEGGKLMIETSNVRLLDSDIEATQVLRAGSYVLVSVSDSGFGIPDDVKNNIFDPFFTTKDIGKGTGLGLSTAYGIIKQSGGDIVVYSENNKGTTFKIYLPRIIGELDPNEITHSGQMPAGNETILVVEDDQKVLMIASKVLTSLGYEVVSALSADEALFECQKRKQPFDLLLTDIVMLNMDGPELVKEVRALWPDIKVLYMSGYAPKFALNYTDIESTELFLHKPFRSVSLAQKVREILDEGKIIEQ